MRTLRNGVALLLALVLTLSIAACGKTQNEDALKARFTVLVETDAHREMLEDPDKYADEIASYGLDDFAATFADEDKFRSFNVEIIVQNTNDFDVRLLNMQMETGAQGKNGVWFSPQSDEMRAVGLPANYSGEETLYCHAIADAKLSKGDVLRVLGEMGISCVYMQGSEIPEEDAEIDPAQMHTSVVLYEE